MRFLKFAALFSLLALPALALPYTNSSRLDTYTADNVGNLTITGVDQWGTQAGGQITFNGSTSGSTILKPSAVAGSGTVTLPTNTGTIPAIAGTLVVLSGKTLTANNTLTLAGTDSTTMTFPSTSATIARTDAANTFTGTQTIGALTVTTVNGLTVTASTGTLTIPNGVTLTGPASSGTAATLAGTETLSGKTLTSPVINGPAPVACGSTCTLGAANVGTYTRLDTAGGSAATLPAATGTGTTYKLYVSVATTSAQDKVLLTTVTDTIIGTAQGENAGTAKVFVGNAGTYHSLQMPFAGTQPSGGFIGDTIECTDVASTIWKCDIKYQAGTTPTTPYSTSTT